MTQKIFDKDVQHLVHIMKQQGMDVGLDGAYGRWRVTNQLGTRDLSPRLGNRAVYDWLQAYRDGWEAGHAYAELRHTHVVETD